MAVTGNEYVKLSQLKMLSDNLESDILGQFSDELDLIIGADTTPIPDAIAWADRINGEDVSGGSGGNAPAVETVQVIFTHTGGFTPDPDASAIYVDPTTFATTITKLSSDVPITMVKGSFFAQKAATCELSSGEATSITHYANTIGYTVHSDCTFTY